MSCGVDKTRDDVKEATIKGQCLPLTARLTDTTNRLTEKRQSPPRAVTSRLKGSAPAPEGDSQS